MRDRLEGFAWVAASTTAVLAAGVLSCGYDAESTSDATRERLAAQAQIAVMVLPPEEFGALTEGLVTWEGSGYGDALDAAERSLDPDDSYRDWLAAGFVSSYLLSYELGELAVSSSVVLWADSDAADAGMRAYVDEWRGPVGTERFGRRITQYEEFRIPEIGDEAVGLEMGIYRLDTQSTETSTEVFFRFRNLTGRTLISRLDTDADAGDRDAVTRAATRLESRMRAAQRNQLRGTPVPIPVAAPPDGTDLTVMMLAPEDLGSDFSIVSEGYIASRPGEFDYRRRFDAHGQEVGASQIAELEHHVVMFPGAEAASRWVDEFTGFVTAGSLSNITPAEQERLDLGDEGVLLWAEGRLQEQGYQIAWVVVRRDRFVSTLIVSGWVHDLRTDDVLSLNAIVTERMVIEAERSLGVR